MLIGGLITKDEVAKVLRFKLLLASCHVCLQLHIPHHPGTKPEVTGY